MVHAINISKYRYADIIWSKSLIVMIIVVAKIKQIV